MRWHGIEPCFNLANLYRWLQRSIRLVFLIAIQLYSHASKEGLGLCEGLCYRFAPQPVCMPHLGIKNSPNHKVEAWEGTTIRPS